MELNVEITLPHVWGQMPFVKTEWGAINYLVGPNGTGKTLFAEALREQCNAQGLRARYLSAERLAGLEKQAYGLFGYSNLQQGFNIGQFLDYLSQGGSYGLAADAWVILKQKLDVKIRVEATLSALFGRRLRLAEEGGFLKPKMQKVTGGSEYGLRESECHGLKELVALLAFLYDDQFNCLIVDEPELHLHPQYQAFFLEEVRRLSGDPRESPESKCFFLISHSPYSLDLRSLADVEHCIVFQPGRVPSYIRTDDLTEDDRWKLRRLLPRLNTHHKQFFFASQPVFVEGYSDQQIFTLIEEVRQRRLGACGVSFIDVMGKDELDLFFRLCHKLGIDARVIADLDALVEGELRQSVARDPRVTAYLQREGLGTDGMVVIGELLRQLTDLVTAIEATRREIAEHNPVAELGSALASGRDDLDKKRRIALAACRLREPDIAASLPNLAAQLEVIRGRSDKLLAAFAQAGVFLLPKGALENYMPSYTGSPYLINGEAKLRTFDAERDEILQCDKTSVKNRYADLCGILDAALSSTDLDVVTYLGYVIGDWIHDVQSAWVRGELQDLASLQQHGGINWATYSRVLDVLELQSSPNGLRCRIKLKPVVDANEREVEFTERTVAASFRIGDTGGK